MRIRVFTEIEVDDERLLEAIQSQVPDARLDQLPEYVANVINGIVGQSLPGAQYSGSVTIPELVNPNASGIIVPSGKIIT